MLALQWDVEIPEVMPHGETIGIDVGIIDTPLPKGERILRS
jgi:hypothetical protein